MQIVGLAPAFQAIDVIVNRSPRPEVSQWAERVIRRHLKRNTDTHTALRNEKAVLKATNDLPREVVDRILAAFRSGEPIYAPDRGKLADFIVRGLDTMDFIESLNFEHRLIRHIERLSWPDAEKMSVAWHERIKKARAISGNLMKDTRKIYEFEDGSFMAELTSRLALENEGNSMGHCVGSYWNRVETGQIKIVSLRSESGEPSVTVELAKLPEITEGPLKGLKFFGRPKAGRAFLATGIDWQAVQIRGRSNKPPVPKYAAMLSEWMREAKIPSTELGGYEMTAQNTVYITSGTKNLRVFQNADEALKSIQNDLDWLIEKPKDALYHFKTQNGHREVFVDAKDTNQAEKYLLKWLAVSEQVAESHPDGAEKKSHIDVRKMSCWNILSIAQNKGLNLERVESEICSVLLKADRENSVGPEERQIELATGFVIPVRSYTVPTSALSFLNDGRALAYRDEILDGFRLKIELIARDIMQNPGSVCSVSVSTADITPELFKVISIISGAESVLSEAEEFAFNSIKERIRTINIDLKKRRSHGEQLNFALNFLSDGYENRLDARVREAAGNIVLKMYPLARQPLKIKSSSPSLRLMSR